MKKKFVLVLFLMLFVIPFNITKIHALEKITLSSKSTSKELTKCYKIISPSIDDNKKNTVGNFTVFLNDDDYYEVQPNINAKSGDNIAIKCEDSEKKQYEYRITYTVGTVEKFDVYLSKGQIYTLPTEYCGTNTEYKYTGSSTFSVNKYGNVWGVSPTDKAVSGSKITIDCKKKKSEFNIIYQTALTSLPSKDEKGNPYQYASNIGGNGIKTCSFVPIGTIPNYNTVKGSIKQIQVEGKDYKADICTWPTTTGFNSNFFASGTTDCNTGNNKGYEQVVVTVDIGGEIHRGLVCRKGGDISISTTCEDLPISYYENQSTYIYIGQKVSSELKLDKYYYEILEGADLVEWDEGCTSVRSKTAYGENCRLNFLGEKEGTLKIHVSEGVVGTDTDHVAKCIKYTFTKKNTLEPGTGDKVYGCQVIPEEIKEWINRALNLVKYVALVLVIILGVLDFIKAAASGEAEDMKKSGQSFLKRVIAVIILFLLPVIVELILNLVEIYGADSTCIQ